MSITDKMNNTGKKMCNEFHRPIKGLAYYYMALDDL